MGFFTGAIFSEALNMDTNIGVILPQDSRYHRGLAAFPHGVAASERPRTLILLHGMTDNWAAWGHRSRILEYAEAHDIAVIMPEVQRSFYQDMVNGEAYFTYISEELPKLAGALFNVAVEPGQLMVAGLSMGGYGALRCGLLHPDRYCADGAFSRAFDLSGRVVLTPHKRETLHFERVVKGIFGEKPEVPPLAQLHLLAEYAGHLPHRAPILMTCGTEDPLYPENEEFYRFLKAHGLTVTFESWSGAHEWRFWDRSIQMFLEGVIH